MRRRLAIVVGTTARCITIFIGSLLLLMLKTDLFWTSTMLFLLARCVFRASVIIVNVRIVTPLTLKVPYCFVRVRASLIS